MTARASLATAILAGCMVGLWKLDAVTPPNALGHLARAMAILPEPAPPRSPEVLWWKQ